MYTWYAIHFLIHTYQCVFKNTILHIFQYYLNKKCLLKSTCYYINENAFKLWFFLRTFVTPPSSSFTSIPSTFPPVHTAALACPNSWRNTVISLNGFRNAHLQKNPMITLYAQTRPNRTAWSVLGKPASCQFAKSRRSTTCCKSSSPSPATEKERRLYVISK